MHTSKTFNVKGMHCASCANIIEKTLKKTEGVQSVEVNYGTETAKVTFDEHTTDHHHLSKKVEPLGYSLDASAEEMGMSVNEHAAHLGLNQTKQAKLAEVAAMERNVMVVIPLTIFSIFVMAWEILMQFNILPPIPYFWKEFFHHLLPLFATYTLFVIGKPYLLGLYRFLRYGKANMDSLVGLGTLAAFAYSFIITAFEETLRPYLNVEHSYYDVTIVVIAFITLGKYLEVRSKIKTGDAIEKLLNLQAKTALVIRDDEEVEVPLEDVKHDEIVVVKPAGKIPVDGVVLSGSSYVDESLVTGESNPTEKKEGDSVIAGTINTTGSFTFRATKVGSETMLAHIVKMVTEAQSTRAPIQGLADKISAVFVPIVLVIAVITFITWLLVGTQYLGFAQALSYGLVSFVGVLVIACPCAVGLATPTAIIVGVGKGAQEGILVKDAATLEKLHTVDTVVLDKTGTITHGKPEVISIKNLSGQSNNEFIATLGSLEKKSEHPIATAIVAYVKGKKIDLHDVTDFEAIKGQGLHGSIGNTIYYAGNSKLMKDLGLPLDNTLIDEATSNGQTPIILATKEKILGIVFVADAIKPEAAQAIKELHKQGVKVIMLTGDTKNTANYIARQSGIDEVMAEVSPEDKLNKIKELQTAGKVVAMAGDGINDAPALAQADIGIAMATGTDVAIESAGITLLHGDISKIVKAINLSKVTMRGIKQNLFWAFIYNIIGIPLASGIFFPLFGWLLSPVFAGLAMGLSSVSVVGNSLRLKTKKL